MKLMNYLLAACAAAALALAGCSKSSTDAGSTAVGTVNFESFEKAFAGAETTLKGSADKIISAIKSGDFANALTELKSLASHATLSGEQKSAISNLMAQVQKMASAVAGKVGDAAGKAMDAAGKAVGDAKKAVGQ